MPHPPEASVMIATLFFNLIKPLSISDSDEPVIEFHLFRSGYPHHALKS